MNRNKLLSLVLFLFIAAFSTAQEGITLEKIWKDYAYYPDNVPGFNFLQDGKHYTKSEDNKINKYDFTTGDFVETLFDAASFNEKEGFDGNVASYSFNADESMIMIKSESESIYRHSTRAKFFVFDKKSKSWSPVHSDLKIRYATFSPDAKKVAYVSGNDLYYKDLTSGEVTRITNDGKKNEIINGATDWVYEEEFAFARAFEWSGDSKKIAFIRFDESAVKEFTMTRYNDDAYPEYETFKYPKVGEGNANVTSHIYNLESKKLAKADIGSEEDIYIPRIKWTKDANTLCVYKMNRHQNHLQLFLTDAKTGKSKIMLEEKNKYYIDITDDIRFLKDGKHFIWSSEKSGYNHLYKYDMKGKEKNALTSGSYDVTRFYGVDEKNNEIYYQAAKVSPLEREIYKVNLKGKRDKKLTNKVGTNNAQFSSTFDYYVWTYSNANSPSEISVHDKKGKLIRSLVDNKELAAKQKTEGVQPVEFFDFKTSEGVSLNGYMIKPADFDETKEYPVFMYLYGGPGSQQVLNRWGGMNYWWFQMLSQQGYVVACVDNRGTGARGEEFKKMTYMKLGHYETIDQIEAAKYLGGLPYTDASRIGIFGWSYGGYMSSLCLFKGNDVFKSAIAVAPVTNWKWYDSVYTERYMRTDDENPEGYKDNSPVYFADQLKGNYLLVHGIADDNVHFQNAAEMMNALIKANKQFDTYSYPNRNHGIYGGLTRLHLYTKMTNFVLEKL